MTILYWNILGVIMLISLLIFISKFYKNNNVINNQIIDDIKMKIKIVKNIQSDINYNSNNYSNQNKGSESIKNYKSRVVFIKLETPNIINDSRLVYLGDSRNACTIYAILQDNIKYLTKIKYSIINNINMELLNSNKDYTSPENIKKLESTLLRNQKL